MAVKTYQDSKDKYLKEKVDTFVLRVPKGKKDEIAEYAANLGMSLNGYITSLVFADMGQDTGTAKKAQAPKVNETKVKKATKSATKAKTPKPEEKKPEPVKEQKIIIIPADPEEDIIIPEATEETQEQDTKKKKNMPSFLL